MQLYLYTLAAAPSDPTDLDVLCVQTSPNKLRDLLFEPRGEQPQVDARLSLSLRTAAHRPPLRTRPPTRPA